MEIGQRNAYDMLVRVGQFGDENAADFPAPSAAAENFAVARQVVGNLRASAAAQVSGALRDSTAQKMALRHSLRDRMRHLSRTARAIGIDRPGLSQRFRRPDGDNDQVLLAVARQFAADAAPLQAEFAHYGLPATFVADLNADIAAFETVLEDKATALNERVTATATIDEELERGLKAARRLDAAVRNIYRDQPAKLAAWTSARHIARTNTSTNTPAKPAAKPTP